jgi:hypothetical protein
MTANPHIRVERAAYWSAREHATQTPNDDEQLYSDRRASYSKGLPHDGNGHVDPAAFAQMLEALTSGEDDEGADGLDALPVGKNRANPNPLRTFTSPKAGLAAELIGGSAKHYAIAPAPAFASARIMAEIVENYWMAILRDKPFRNYGPDADVAQAVADLQSLGTRFTGPDPAHPWAPAPSAQTLFRSTAPGEALGPYVSQFLLQHAPFGAQRVDQKIQPAAPNTDYVTDWNEWLAIQNGEARPPATLQNSTVFVRNGRDIAQYVHIDQLYQAYFVACLILLGYPVGGPNGSPAFAPNIPYVTDRASKTQSGFATFGGPHLLALLTEVSTRGLKAVWYQKWYVHRRLRPETFAGRIHNQLIRHASTYDLDIATLQAASNLWSRLNNVNWLLPLAFPEGSPTHPAYGAGHATVAGACTTILKAWFNGSLKLSALHNPVTNSLVVPYIASANGQARNVYAGVDAGDLTIEGELNKLASNIGVGRDIAGVHWRSDHTASIALGEQVAIDTLRDYAGTFEERNIEFRFRKFDGSTAVINRGGLA